MGAALFASFLERVCRLERRGATTRGMLLSPLDERGRERPPVEAVFFGEEGEEGFAPSALTALRMRARRNRRVMVAPFRSQATPPVRFSSTDYVAHDPPFGWHLVVGTREAPGAAARPAVQPFMFRQEGDARLAEPVLLLVEGLRPELAAVERLMAGELPRPREKHASRLGAMHRS